ncbi:hypothetical protein PL81_27045 [Streptomyces sp. RSD-27]|nr:hypothetical protein PL81_27280 [Streptomyces sp. RSD-27]KIF02964.1 hypothetical protein PL81_27045 [Streptomyces sp. RSD-27]
MLEPIGFARAAGSGVAMAAGEHAIHEQDQVALTSRVVVAPHLPERGTGSCAAAPPRAGRPARGHF